MKDYGNKLSFPTFASSNVNGITLDVPELTEHIKERMPSPIGSGFGFSEVAVNQAETQYSSYTKIEAGTRLDRDGAQGAELIDIVAKDGESVSVILNYRGKSDYRNTFVRVHVGKGATLNLYVVQLEADSTVIESIGGEVEECGQLNIYQYEVGSVDLYANLKVALRGEAAQLKVDSIYFGFGDHSLNMLYDVRHEGKASVSDVQIHGALKDRAYKNLKSTLDFIEGSAGSKGSEEEYAILLDDAVRCLSVPVLLTHEDDVEGNHAASAGKIDGELLFYLMSRGLDEAQARSLIVLSKFQSAIDAVEDEALRDELMATVQGIVRMSC
ncbi:SufD family Fe-S cluster assembly protein [Peptoniphilus equinus]|uniref:SufD family Fe-S cluster assembly protein n=1 Tax=Peptoniphilus equinus TaxID=3016343 RepID=A0ABY7QV97_9FIRM|nr:SufD family Fe-S cluster assembly protein [Peptoniphilus equinus]WBW50321.1 SufD family Fe-S cluster assembly protein [Peptoniphilus equinus]